ncbi:MAG: class I SAM-dependent methyltransferase [Olsenella profusa]
MGLLRTYFNNTRKPEGVLGRGVLANMNREHAQVSDWGMGHLSSVHASSIVELGCGGGRNVGKLLQMYPAARLVAVDYSTESLAKTAQVNQASVTEGRCELLEADVSHLPLEDGTFDLVTAFETVYFWPSPVESFAEVHRVLADGGAFLIVNESDGTDPSDDKWKKIIDGLQIYTAGQLHDYLAQAGFSQVTVDHDPQRHRLCVLARK